MLSAIAEWLQAHELLVIGITVGSIMISVGGILLTPWLVARIPADYFVGDAPHAWAWQEHHPVVRVVLNIGKNILGGLLILLGIVLCLPGIPGPGIITIILGLMLTDLPGKRKMERWVVSRRPIFNTLNALRRKLHQPPLVLDAPPPTAVPPADNP